MTALPICFGASSFAVNVPVSLVGANPGVGAIVGTFRQASDAAHTSPAVTPVTEPGSLALFATLAAVMLGAWGPTRDRKSPPRRL